MISLPLHVSHLPFVVLHMFRFALIIVIILQYLNYANYEAVCYRIYQASSYFGLNVFKAVLKHTQIVM